MYLLFTDLHLDDNPANEYRWEVFEEVRKAKSQFSISHVHCLGDFVDRKDHFSAAFINRLIAELKQVSPITILRGNHDTPLHPPSYFSFWTEEFLNSPINYVSEPTAFNSKLLLLPFSARPKVDWKDLRLRDYKSVFMHATVTGAVTENGQVMENKNFPLLPGGVKYYSGDIHTQQKVGNVEYVGCPHPVKFGDSFRCRMLVIDEDTFEIVHEIETSPQRRLMVDISSIDDLLKIRVRKGDQVKLRVICGPSEIGGFGEFEYEVARWASEKGITVAGTEVIVDSELNRDVDINQTPEVILKQFAEHEGLAEDMVETGLGLLRETM
jgi:hypothetical protein